MLLSAVMLFVAPWIVGYPNTAEDAHPNELGVGMIVCFTALARFVRYPGKWPDLSDQTGPVQSRHRTGFRSTRHPHVQPAPARPGHAEPLTRSCAEGADADPAALRPVGVSGGVSGPVAQPVPASF
ncbi:SPW repeat protein [Streptomyces griseomycini]